MDFNTNTIRTLIKPVIMLSALCYGTSTIAQQPLAIAKNNSSNKTPLIANLRPDVDIEEIEESQFGYGVSVSGNRIAVGAPGTPNKGDSGSVYIFEYNDTSWNQIGIITPDDYQEGDFFGGILSLDGDRVAIGSVGVDNTQANAGAVYTYVYDGQSWNLEQKFSPVVPVENEYFGQAIKLENNRLLVGTAKINGFGGAYVFELEKGIWLQKQKLISSDLELSDLFGVSLDLDGDRAIIGAYYNDTFNGAAYVFDYDGKTWNQSSKIFYDLLPGSDFFGYAVALSGDTVMVSALAHDDGAGAVYAYELIDNQWQRTAQLNRLIGTDFDVFGYDIDLKNDLALIGTPRFSVDLIEYGAAYLYKKTGENWQQIALIRDENSGAGDRFGQSVSLGTNQAVVGAINANTNGPQSGSAQVFAFDDDLIFSSGFSPLPQNCFNTQRPNDLLPVNGSYFYYNDGFNFGESTNTSFLAPVSTDTYLTLGGFNFRTPDSRRRMIFNDAPTNQNLMDEATISISECPGDFTETATCIEQVNNNSTVLFSNRPADSDNPIYCVLDPMKDYYYNLIMSPDPLNTSPSCADPADTDCAAFHAEGALP